MPLDPAAWMAGVSSTTPLSKMTIPGTHDTGALLSSGLNTCQTLCLRDQLDAGIRFLDIRCLHTRNIFKIYHGIVDEQLHFDTDVRDVCLAFLRDHSSETIVMSINEVPQTAEQKALSGCSRSFARTCAAYIYQHKDSWYTDGSVPLLRLARGKIVLFRRFGTLAPDVAQGIDASPWPENSPAPFLIGDAIKVQDRFGIAGVGAIGSKWDLIKELLDEARTATDDVWYINFLSGTAAGIQTDPGPALYTNPTPSEAAFGMAGVAGINSRLTDYLNGLSGCCMGTVVMDFPQHPDEMLARLIGLNGG